MSEGDIALEKEYKRWRDYANILLIALTVLFAGPMISGQKSLFSIISGISGAVGIILVVMWHAKEYRIQINKKPAFLLAASVALGVQATFLVFQLIFL